MRMLSDAEPNEESIAGRVRGIVRGASMWRMVIGENDVGPAKAVCVPGSTGLGGGGAGFLNRTTTGSGCSDVAIRPCTVVAVIAPMIVRCAATLIAAPPNRRRRLARDSRRVPNMSVASTFG